MKATDVIRRDHRAIEDLFTEFRESPPDRQEEMEDTIFDALDRHEKMEDDFFYPAIEDELESDKLAELENEQTRLKVEVLAARALPADRYRRIDTLIDTVLAHAEKEERDILPEAERVLGSEKLEALGQEMEPESVVAGAEI